MSTRQLKTNLLVVPIIALLFAGSVRGDGGPGRSEWRTYSSHQSQIQFAVPEDWNVYERKVCIDLMPPNSILLLKIAPKEVSEEALLVKPAQIEIHVVDLPEPTTLDEWMADSYPPQGDLEILEEKEVEIAGEAVILRESRLTVDVATITEVFVIKARRGYYFSSRHDPAHEFVFQRLLESLRFQESDDAHVENASAGIASTESLQRVVRMVYLIPADKSFRQDYVTMMENAIQHLQIWYRNELGNSKSFSLHTPVVEVYNTTHPAAWYQTNQVGNDSSLWFWDNVLKDGFALTGGSFNDFSNLWTFYTDADPACGQI